MRFVIKSLILFLVTFGAAQAAEPLVLAPDFESAAIDSHIDAWKGQENRELRELAKATPAWSGRTRFNYTDVPIWFRFKVSNPEAHSRALILSLDPPLVDNIILAELDSEGHLLQTASYDPQHRTRGGALSRRKPSFRLDFPPNAVATVILKLRSVHSLDLHLTLATPESDDLSDLRQHILFGAYYGLFFAIFFLNILLFAAIREKIYLYYVLFLLSLGVMISCLNGMVDFWFAGPFLPSRYLGAVSSLTLMLAHLFCRQFLHTRKVAPRMDRVHLALAWVSVVLILVDLSPVFPVWNVVYGHTADLLIVLSLLANLVSTVIAIRKRRQAAFFFLLSWGPLMGLIGLYYSGTYGLIHGNTLTSYSVQIGSALEMILLSAGLAYRVHLMNTAKIRAEEKARETEKLRSLIHIICHDLRNPLTVVAGIAQSRLRRGQSEWAPVVRAAQNQKDILDYVQIKESLESGKQELRIVPVKVHDAIENARFVFEQRLLAKKIEWVTRIDPNSVVLADHTLLTHTVVSNLISNAIKFTREGGRIEIEARPRGDQVLLEIKDSGIGIPRELIGGLFSLDAPTTRPGTSGERGTGFGMPLVKTAVHSFGGKIWVDSTPEGSDRPGGTRVTVELRKADLLSVG